MGVFSLPKVEEDGSARHKKKCPPSPVRETQVNNEKKGPWLFRGFVGDEILPSYIGILINHYKDPYYRGSGVDC